MQSKKHYFLTLFLLPISLLHLAGQNISIVGGLGLSNQDRRPFTRTGLQHPLNDNNSLDYDIAIYAEGTLFKGKFWQINGGLGFAESTTEYSRQFNQQALGVFTDDIKYIKKYAIDKLIIPISSKLYFKEKSRFYFQFTALPAISFKKVW